MPYDLYSYQRSFANEATVVVSLDRIYSTFLIRWIVKYWDNSFVQT